MSIRNISTRGAAHMFKLSRNAANQMLIVAMFIISAAYGGTGLAFGACSQPPSAVAEAMVTDCAVALMEAAANSDERGLILSGDILLKSARGMERLPVGVPSALALYAIRLFLIDEQATADEAFNLVRTKSDAFDTLTPPLIASMLAERAYSAFEMKIVRQRGEQDRLSRGDAFNSERTKAARAIANALKPLNGSNIQVPPGIASAAVAGAKERLAIMAAWSLPAQQGLRQLDDLIGATTSDGPSGRLRLRLMRDAAQMEELDGRETASTARIESTLAKIGPFTDSAEARILMAQAISIPLGKTDKSALSAATVRLEAWHTRLGERSASGDLYYSLAENFFLAGDSHAAYSELLNAARSFALRDGVRAGDWAERIADLEGENAAEASPSQRAAFLESLTQGPTLMSSDNPQFNELRLRLADAYAASGRNEQARRIREESARLSSPPRASVEQLEKDLKAAEERGSSFTTRIDLAGSIAEARMAHPLETAELWVAVVAYADLAVEAGNSDKAKLMMDRVRTVVLQNPARNHEDTEFLFKQEADWLRAHGFGAAAESLQHSSLDEIARSREDRADAAVTTGLSEKMADAFVTAARRRAEVPGDGPAKAKEEFERRIAAVFNDPRTRAEAQAPLILSDILFRYSRFLVELGDSVAAARLERASEQISQAKNPDEWPAILISTARPGLQAKSCSQGANCGLDEKLTPK